MTDLRRTVARGLLASAFLASITSAATSTWSPGANVEVREGDVWSPASIVRNEGRKWLIHYGDGTEEWVTADRVRSVAGAAPADASPRSIVPAAGAKQPADDAVATDPAAPTKLELHVVKSEKNPPKGSMPIRPTTRPTAAFTDLIPGGNATLGRVERTIACADKPSLLVLVGPRQGDDTPLLLIDTNNPTGPRSRVFSGRDQDVISAADGGRLLLTQTGGERNGLQLWEWRGDKYEMTSNVALLAGPADPARALPTRGTPKVDKKEVDSAILLSPTHALVKCDARSLFLIDFATRRQIAQLDCSQLTPHPSGVSFSAEKDGQIVAIRASDLSVVGQIGNGGSDPSVDLTGGYLALRSGDDVRLLKAGSGDRVGVIERVAPKGRLDLLGPAGLMIDGKYFYDLKAGVAAWTYDAGDATSMLLANGQMLYVSSADGAVHAYMAALPDAAGLAAVKKAPASAFDLAAGAHVSIAGDLGATGDAAVARKNLEQAIAAAGHVVDAAAKQFVLAVDVKPGPVGKFTSAIPGTLPPVYKEYDAPSSILTLTLTRDGTSIWTHEIRFGAGFILTTKGREPIEESLARAGRPDASRLASVALPSYLLKTQTTATGGPATLGRSTLTPTGFVPATSAP